MYSRKHVTWAMDFQCWTCDVLGVFYSFEASNTVNFWTHFNWFFQGRPSDHWKPRLSQNRNPTVSGFFRSSCLAACMRAVACSSPSAGHLHWWGPYHVVWSKKKTTTKTPESRVSASHGWRIRTGSDLIFMFKITIGLPSLGANNHPSTPQDMCARVKSRKMGEWSSTFNRESLILGIQTPLFTIEYINRTIGLMIIPYYMEAMGV